MKKKMVGILTAAFCVSALLAGCGFADTAKTSASSAGAASSSADGTTTFTVGFDAEYPPYGYMDDETGDYTGFDLELAEAVCEIYDWKLVKTPINWDAKDTELNSGAIDCIWNGFTMNGREDDYTWSDPYVDNSQVMVVSENSGINSLSIWQERRLVCRQHPQHSIFYRVRKKAVRKNSPILSPLCSSSRITTMRL